jgi:hypothetical protein
MSKVPDITYNLSILLLYINILGSAMRFTLVFLGILFSAHASAGVYKCTGADGKTAYQSKPCVEGQRNIELNVKTGGSTDLDEQQKQQLEQQKKLDQDKLEQERLKQRQAQLKLAAANESAKNQFLIKNNPKKFSAYAIPPYQSDQLPDVVKNHQNRLPDIERFRRQAAEQALATGTCSRVEASELNARSTQDALVFLINCSSGKSFYFTEQELTK